ncbi:CoA transferase [Streptomyces longispororuber]|uniref:CoA transferase n=1 Tax=Streptomyces longispororuber TaxID=68230 RepID=A0A918ZEQ4_9ACTN|nr:CoA transferase [Streptomyces longispororuber]GHE48587.1 CoA transferase [Streptomyces longispororuber]
MKENQSPLHGVTVLDFTHIVMGPCCTQLLGDFGADVLKIEKPDKGDMTRTTIPDPAGFDNPIFLSLNRNKRSVAVDVRADAGRDAVLGLARTADVVVSNFRPGVMERLGFGWEALRELNPRLIWAAGSGFGPRGPYRHKGSQDAVTQAFTGVMHRRSSPELPLSVYPTALCDFSAGMHLVQGILLALLARARTGRGQRVDVSLYDSMLAMQMQEAAVRLNRGYEVNWGTMPLTGVFETQDGALCFVGGFHPDPIPALADALELGEALTGRPEFATWESQFAHRPELGRIFAERLRTGTTAHWLRRLEAANVLCAPVRDLAEALRDPQTVLNGMLLELTHPTAGTVQVLGAPVHLSETPARIRHVPPRLGEHSDAVLREAGYDERRITDLRASGVLR